MVLILAEEKNQWRGERGSILKKTAGGIRVNMDISPKRNLSSSPCEKLTPSARSNLCYPKK